MAKPIYYLWQNKNTDMEELEREREKYTKAGFMVPIIDNTSDDPNIEEALLNIIKNHLDKM
ncbi:MAG: hypothetical protein KIC94_05925 [Clostridiales bacterium]|nr:hypothetical protein [uncultured Anaerosporobacter sp.]MBS5932396.1 hypothetical protein [Clostridiales bacterium]